jgi:pimeloyl-ACP methyl ester carboxylesterase
MEALARMARVIVWDGRGIGASERIRDFPAATSEILVDDARAVLGAAASDRATMFEMNASANSALFAATEPDRVRSLIFVNLRRSFPELRDLSASSACDWR